MSLLAYHAMQNCDVVVYDALVNPDILRWVRVGRGTGICWQTWRQALARRSATFPNG